MVWCAVGGRLRVVWCEVCVVSLCGVRMCLGVFWFDMLLFF